MVDVFVFKDVSTAKFMRNKTSKDIYNPFLKINTFNATVNVKPKVLLTWDHHQEELHNYQEDPFSKI